MRYTSARVYIYPSSPEISNTFSLYYAAVGVHLHDAVHHTNLKRKEKYYFETDSADINNLLQLPFPCRVFTRASEHIMRGETPYLLETYRYTPALAWLLTPNVWWFSAFGKLLFVAGDVWVGVMIYKMLIAKGTSSVRFRLRACSVSCCFPSHFTII